MYFPISSLSHIYEIRRNAHNNFPASALSRILGGGVFVGGFVGSSQLLWAARLDGSEGVDNRGGNGDGGGREDERSMELVVLLYLWWWPTGGRW